MKLYTYCLLKDTGAAPNPFWGVCTLAICKPAIRRTSKVGDWIVGVGSKNSPLGDISGHVVYAMQVTGKMTMKEYDDHCRSQLPQKIPNLHTRYGDTWLGDCLYDYSLGEPPIQRRGAHSGKDSAMHYKRDLGGINVLLSNHFYYFGDQPVKLLPELQSIGEVGRGHKSDTNDAYLQKFIFWLENSSFPLNQIVGRPQIKDFRDRQQRKADKV